MPNMSLHYRKIFCKAGQAAAPQARSFYHSAFAYNLRLARIIEKDVSGSSAELLQNCAAAAPIYIAARAVPIFFFDYKLIEEICRTFLAVHKQPLRARLPRVSFKSGSVVVGAYRGHLDLSALQRDYLRKRSMIRRGRRRVNGQHLFSHNSLRGA